MDTNPNPKDKRKAHLENRIKRKPISEFDKPKNDWKLSENDKKKVLTVYKNKKKQP